MLLHLSTGCNIQCARCLREYDRSCTTALSRTGRTIITVDEAFNLVRRRREGAEPPARVEIGGLGEPLLAAGTYILLRRLYAAYPDLPVSVRTNGVLLPDRLKELVRSGLKGVLVAVNAVSQDTADSLYDWVIYRGRRSSGRDASHLILRQQWKGLANAVEAGVETTVCTTRMAGVNDHELDRLVSKARLLGADRVEIVDQA